MSLPDAIRMSSDLKRHALVSDESLVSSTPTIRLSRMGSELKRHTLVSDESLASSTPAIQLSKSKERDAGGYRRTTIDIGSKIRKNAEDDYPDGGLAAWSVLVGATCAIFATWGFLDTWGVFQSYYQRVLIPDTPTSTIAWIGSTQFALAYLPGLVAGRLCDLGYFKRTLLIPSVIIVLATVITAECNKFWQLLVCQGMVIGICCGMISSPIPAIISHWFNKRRSLALGVMTTGSAIGGVILPIATSRLIDLIGFRWTMRVVALIELVMLTIVNLTLKRRIQPPKNAGPFFAWHDFKKPAFNVFTIAGIINLLGFYTVTTYIDLSATRAGIPASFSFYLVAISNAGGGLGRVVSGILADQFGALNITVLMTLLCAVTTYIWPFVTTKGGLIVIALVYGFSCGGFIALVAVPLVMMGDIRDSGSRTGIYMTCIAFGVVAGPPISGAIDQNFNGFKGVGFYAGSCIVVAVALMCLTKYLMIGSLHGKC